MKGGKLGAWARCGDVGGGGFELEAGWLRAEGDAVCSRRAYDAQGALVSAVFLYGSAP